MAAVCLIYKAGEFILMNIYMSSLGKIYCLVPASSRMAFKFTLVFYRIPFLTSLRSNCQVASVSAMKELRVLLLEKLLF